MVARVKLNRPYLRAWRKSRDELTRQIADLGALVASLKVGTREYATALRILSRLDTELSTEFGAL